jgi:hypothetical protein
MTYKETKQTEWEAARESFYSFVQENRTGGYPSISLDVESDCVTAPVTAIEFASDEDGNLQFPDVSESDLLRMLTAFIAAKFGKFFHYMIRLQSIYIYVT